MRVYLGGEGRNELGEWLGRHGGATIPPSPGVVEALARRATDANWTVVGAVQWRRIRKYRSGENRKAETRNVLGLALLAAEAGADAMVFTRDRDGSVKRQRHVEVGIALVAERFPTIAVGGGMAVEDLDAWLLALLGRTKAEVHRDPKGALHKAGIQTTADKVGVVESADLDNIPKDARSLRTWIIQVREALGG